MVKELKFRDITRKLPITLEIEPNVAKINAKEEDLREVVVTVLDNAVDAIRMKVDRGMGEESDNIKIKVSCLKDERQVEIRIIDTGVGIKKEELKDIFLPYYTTKGSAALYEDYARRRDIRAKDEKEKGVFGTGLGLDLVKNLVEEQIGGTIRVESEYGKGAIFIITVPEGEKEKEDDKSSGS